MVLPPAGPAHSRGIELNIFDGSFQPKPFCGKIGGWFCLCVSAMPGLWIQYHTVKRAGTPKMIFCHKSVIKAPGSIFWLIKVNYCGLSGNFVWCLSMDKNTLLCWVQTVIIVKMIQKIIVTKILKIVGDSMFSLIVMHILLM